MIGVRVTVPVSCFRKGYAREYLETHLLPPPATCYGFLLSLVGECDRKRHIGCRVTAGLISTPVKSVVLRKVWRVKNPRPEARENIRPDYQELLSNLELVLWLDSAEEDRSRPTLDKRVSSTLEYPEHTHRFGGLSLGESTHLVNDVSIIKEISKLKGDLEATVFLLDARGEQTLPVWVDHVQSTNTRYVTGTIQTRNLNTLSRDEIPMIIPP